MSAPVNRNGLLLIALACLAACANSEEQHSGSTGKELTAAEVAERIGCTTEEVALCIESHCQLEEWRCVARDEVRRMFKAGDFNR